MIFAISMDYTVFLLARPRNTGSRSVTPDAQWSTGWPIPAG